MNPSPSTPPRFLPTLTEVVDPASLGLPPTLTPVPEPIVQTPDREQLVQLVLQQVDEAIESRLRQHLELLLQDHLQTMTALLRNELEPLVQASVAELLDLLVDQDKLK